MDTEGQLARVERGVASREREGTPTKVVTLQQTYPVSREELWDACTRAERISRWLMPISGDLVLGGHYQLEGNAGGTIERCERPDLIAVTWEYAGDVSWVVATLTGEDEQATLRVEHTAHVDQERWEQFGPGAVGIGWDMMLLGLALHLSTGASMDPAEGMAWATSDAGKAFMAESVQAWSEAQVAGGEDAERARASAERCLAAYTGGA
jgi:uncharacterized protein YndB with AHSA1/START domain